MGMNWAFGKNDFVIFTAKKVPLQEVPFGTFLGDRNEQLIEINGPKRV